MDAHGEQHHLVSPRVYFVVWVGLLALTGLTVGAHYVDMAHLAVFTAIFVATLKATLVLLYFMHLRFERPFYMGMVLVVLVTFAIFLVLTFSDYFFR